MSVAHRNREKFTKTHYLWISRSLKVIDVGTHGKVVGSACYNKKAQLTQRERATAVHV